MDAEALGLRQERPGGLAVDLVSVAQPRFERARVRRVEPLQEVRAAEAVGALGDEAVALLVHGVAVESSGADARAPPAPLEVERLEVRRLDGARGGQSGADALAPAREAGEVVEADGAGEDDVRVVEEGAVELDRRAALGLAERDVARRVGGVVFERADALDD